MPRLKAILLDIDGTLIDSNDAHARCWVEALQMHRRPVSYEQVRPLIGKGGDRLLHELVGIDDASVEGIRIAEDRKEIFQRAYLPALKPTMGTRALLQWLKGNQLLLVVATSAGPEEVGALLRQAGVADLIDCTASSGDAEDTKPAPDIVQSALGLAGVKACEAILIGDTPYDIQAAAAAQVDTLAVRCGDWWNDDELRGAICIYDDPADLLKRIEVSPIADRLRN
jgi:phosphoglycolate phosphatase-like HAD superfamily hydrolase